MKQYTISPSLLTEWGVVKKGLYNATPDRIRDKIAGKWEPNLNVSRGTAVHEIIENGPAAYLQAITKDRRVITGNVSGDPVYVANKVFAGTNPRWAAVQEEVLRNHEPEMDVTWQFEWKAVQAIKECASALPGNMAHEVWNSFWLDIGMARIYVLMKHDGLDVATGIHEIKTTGSTKKYHDYFDQAQWKMSLLGIPEIDQVTYHVIQLPRIPKNNPEVVKWGRYSQLHYQRYPGMEEEIRAELREFLDWMRTAEPDLLSYLEVDDRGKRTNRPPAWDKTEADAKAQV